MVEDTKSRLGRGLAALIGEVEGEFEGIAGETGGRVRKVPVGFVQPNPKNPRKHFDSDELQQLAESIRERGIIQPIVARAVADVPDTFEIIAGERRWRAAQIAGLEEVPVLVVEADDKTALEFAIIENVQRTDLNPIDEATGYRRLMEEFAYSHNDIAKALGKSRVYVTNCVRLLNLPESVRDMVSCGDLSAGHARALLAVENPEAAAKRAVEQGLSVRDLERLAQQKRKEVGEAAAERHRRRGREPDQDTEFLESTLGRILGLRVRIVHNGERGELRIHYETLKQLEDLCKLLNESDTKQS
ncbi:MAG: ParB/RepB/Spo0J family partition protein [Methylobacteriaceae bacterium]|nr:ParB/RepB/Spo0J family partition protein [Methylobacteriaceae bacterium]